MKKLVMAAAVLAVLGAIGFVVLTEPATYRLVRGDPTVRIGATRNLDNGKTLFAVGGCASCHATPGQEDRTKLGGGHALHSPFGTFHVPNISSHPRDGIGGWTPEAFVVAMREGVSPDGRHYYPAFPYTSYQRMSGDDLADLFAYLKSLPAVEGRIRDHDLPFPVSFRRGLGLWKLAFLDGQSLKPDPALSPAVNRGRYLVEGPAHCAECHSPRAFTGAIAAGKRFAGGPDPEGKGFVPNITPDATGIGKWSASEIADLLKSGFTPDYDAVGGSMADVVRNTAQLSEDDRAAMAAYLKALPPVASPPRPKKAN